MFVVFVDYGDAGEYQGKLLLYNRAELKTSDHRPVMALLECEMVCVDEARRQEVFKVREIVSDALILIHFSIAARYLTGRDSRARSTRRHHHRDVISGRRGTG